LQAPDTILHQARNTEQIRNSNDQSKNRHDARSALEYFELSDFEFVSDFAFRICDFAFCLACLQTDAVPL